MFKPSYKITSKILTMLTVIAESKSVIDRAKILPKNEIKLRQLKDLGLIVQVGKGPSSAYVLK